VIDFKVIKLWEIPAELIKQAGLVGILPLMILAKGGKKRKVVEEVISTIRETGGKAARELLSLTFIMAALVFEKDDDQIWLKRRFGMLEDALKESWAYQEILQRGWQEGQEKGWQQGMQQGMQQGIQQGMQQGMQQELMLELQRLRLLLENYVHVHFPNSVELAKKRGNAIEQPDNLQDVLLKVFAAQTEEEAVRILEAN
jgi:predicted transposase YdaD